MHIYIYIYTCMYERMLIYTYMYAYINMKACSQKDVGHVQRHHG